MWNCATLSSANMEFLKNDHDFSVARSGFLWLCVAFCCFSEFLSGSEWLAVAFCGFLEPGVAQRFCLPSLPVADSEVVSYTNDGLQTADVAATRMNSALTELHTAAVIATAATATTIEEPALGYAAHISCDSSC